MLVAMQEEHDAAFEEALNKQSETAQVADSPTGLLAVQEEVKRLTLELQVSAYLVVLLTRCRRSERRRSTLWPSCRCVENDLVANSNADLDLEQAKTPPMSPPSDTASPVWLKLHEAHNAKVAELETYVPAKRLVVSLG